MASTKDPRKIQFSLRLRKDRYAHAINEAFQKTDYYHIGRNHYPKKGDSLAVAQRAKTLQRNFQGYSLYLNGQICGFGISAISKTYRQSFKDLETYYKFFDEIWHPIDRG
ncbi:hypothetical protein [Candidatus Pelagisphaera phototrophica]|uniref:hypothetical protein n=1 Tax=Candidatus Pelagisphaera phototrophica TaxID=2684113 RepID=UPI001A0F4A6F|nr:hypothetical protein [Candidatus Pelagisphaera phototrophica]QXD30547.1 hypothetical protein GA004_09150 [Candidatus Pelagisphaera phototrophica]